MTRKLDSQELELLNSIRARLLLTLDFFQNAQDFSSASRYRAHVERAAAEQNLRAMRLMAREIDQMTVALTPDQRDGLEALLSERLGIDKQVERAELHKRIAKIIARGVVASEKERRRLEDYAEMLEAEGVNAAEVQAVRRLLSSG